MVVLIKGKGDKSNRLMQHVHFKAFCLEKNLTFYNPTLWNLAKYYRYKHSKLNKVILVLYSSIRKLGFEPKIVDFNSPDTDIKQYDTAITGNLVFVSGWHFRVPNLVKKHRKSIIKEFSINKEFYKDNATYKTICSLKDKGYTIVGVHIRRGDYEQFRDGKYYYNDAIYLNKIKEFGKLFKKLSSNPIKFIVFSNERLNEATFQDCLISKNQWYVDHHLMSICDYLMGPPSTFTSWASFIGKVPLLHFYNPYSSIVLEKFEVSNLETPIK